MKSILIPLLAALWLLLPIQAMAKVRLTFHSFNGSALIGRYPHTFVSLDGTIDATGQAVKANFGYSTPSGSAAIFGHDMVPEITTEKNKYISSTNRHFSLEITDEQYVRVLAIVERWRTLPYNLNSRNCIHFVAAIASAVGIKADIPRALLRKPKAWLNYVTQINPRLRAESIR